MKRVLAVLVVAVALLALWLSGIGRKNATTEIESHPIVTAHHEQAIDAPIAAVKGADVGRSTLAAPASATTNAEQPDSIVIRSSIGLELPFAELESDTKGWTRIALDHGTCARSALATTKSVRAPGHVSTSVARDAKEIVLEPDALLVLEGDTLRHCTRTIEPTDQYTDQEADPPLMRDGLRQAITWGWLSDDKWAIALSPDRLEEGYRGACETVIHWRDERETRVNFEGKSGCRERLPLVCEDRVRGLPLQVHVVRPPGFALGRISLALDRVMTGEGGVPVTPYSWGSAYTYTDEEFHARRTIEPGSVDASFDFGPSDARLILSARDETTDVYGRLDFVHDGSPRTLVLRPPFLLTGRLVVPEGSSLPPHVDILCEAFEGKEEIGSWDMGKQNVAVGPGGRFELAGPGNLLRYHRLNVEIPSQLVVTIVAPGFESWNHSFDTQHAAGLDCGDIDLIAKPTPVVLAPGHGLVTKSVKWEGLMTSDGVQRWWKVRDATLLADGSMAVVLQSDEKDPKLFSVWPDEARAWPDPPPSCFLIHVILEKGDEPKAFERDPDGKYRAVEEQVRDIDFDFTSPLDHTGWFFGWEWRGLSDVCSSIDATQIGEKIHLHVRAPLQGVTLLWTTDWEHRLDAGTRGGSALIDTIRAPIVLR